MDRIEPAKRSEIMARIASKNTAPELRVRSVLFRSGYRFRVNVRSLPSSPDIVLPKHKTVVFVNGCFWHGHHCRSGERRPKTNVGFWAKKINRTVQRDDAARARLTALGWKVHVLWTCRLEADIKHLLEALGDDGNVISATGR
ncbi:very short patch repair endonuclease [Mesorhizobium sp. ESP-6-2]|uniref:very short patch repair endonuclease n=1 Tax=Mesorhizobium sp. ESP-6-2 TaxID=2876625 RepID=UPI001CCF16BE|nr:very short patch repair endonuclease [Mesorhizobium sp. ESP-6-2]MBZ9806955.1 very short patch repair endonuclease [Mesorhizobium sp. ESP-6-2]